MFGKGEILFGIEASKTRSGNVLLEMRGEFDLSSLKDLKRNLDACASLREPVTVDLSGVTFLDSGCARELAVRSQLYAHRLILRSPSWETRATIHACGLDDWFDFRPAASGTTSVFSKAI